MTIQLLLIFGTKQVHGLSRGGEDLFLHVEAFASGGFKGDVETALLSCYKGELDPDLQKAFDEAWDVALHNIPELKEGTFTEDGEEYVDSKSGDAADLYIEDGHLKSNETEYGFAVNWSLEKAKERVKHVVLGESTPVRLQRDWVYMLRSGQFCLTADIFIEGNAD